MVKGNTAVVTWATCHAYIQKHRYNETYATMKRMRSVGIATRTQISSSDVIHVNTGRLAERQSRRLQHFIVATVICRGIGPSEDSGFQTGGYKDKHTLSCKPLRRNLPSQGKRSPAPRNNPKKADT